MANDFLALGSAIYSVLDSATTLAVGDTLQPQGGTPDYVIFDYLVTGIDEYTFNGEGLHAEIMVKVISNRIWPGQAMLAYDGTIHPAIQDAALSVNGYNVLRCRRRTRLRYREPEGFWHVGGIYDIDLWTTS